MIHSSFVLAWWARLKVPVIAALIAIGLAVIDDWVREALIFQHELIADGEFWRLFTGHWLHSNIYHLGLNVAGMLIIWIIFWDIGNTRWHWIFLLAPIVFTGLLLWLFNPELHRYVGLSGALHGSIIAFGIADIQKNRLTSVGLIIGVAIKLIYEQWAGGSESLESLIAAKVAVDAHLWGAISGIPCGLWFLFSPSERSAELERSQTSNNARSG